MLRTTKCFLSNVKVCVIDHTFSMYFAHNIIYNMTYKNCLLFNKNNR